MNESKYPDRQWRPQFYMHAKFSNAGVSGNPHLMHDAASMIAAHTGRRGMTRSNIETFIGMARGLPPEAERVRRELAEWWRGDLKRSNGAGASSARATTTRPKPWPTDPVLARHHLQVLRIEHRRIKERLARAR